MDPSIKNMARQHGLMKNSYENYPGTFVRKKNSIYVYFIILSINIYNSYDSTLIHYPKS